MGLVSDFSLQVFVRPALDTRGGEATSPDNPSYRPGTDLFLSLEAPEDGYVAIFHVCEVTGEVKLVFPLEPTDNPKVTTGEQLAPIPGTVEGPAGKHFLKVFWTRVSLLDPRNVNLQDEQVRDAVVEDFFDALEDLSEGDWRSTTTEYEVVAE